MKSKSLVPILISLLFLIACGSSDNADADSPECVTTNCHGKEVTCGFGEPLACTAVYQIGDLCRQYVSCEVREGVCTQNASPKYSECVDCINKCEAKDEIEAFQCDEACRANLNTQ